MAAIVKRLKNPKRRWDEGAAAIEAAFVLPLLFLFVLGIAEFGMALWQWNTMLLAVEQAGRWAMINNADANLVADVETQMQAVLSSAAVCTTPTPGQTCVSASITAGTPSTMTLSAAYSFSPFAAFFQPFTISSQGTVPLD